MQGTAGLERNNFVNTFGKLGVEKTPNERLLRFTTHALLYLVMSPPDTAKIKGA